MRVTAADAAFMRAEHGQGTIEYLAVVLLVACVMGAAAALTVVTGLGERVVHALRQALCVVTGEACDEARRAAAVPCVTALHRHSEYGALQISFVRIGENDVLVRERRSDGSIALTLVDEDSLGLDVGTGVEAHLRWGAHSFAVGRELRAAVLAERGRGRTWIFRDRAEADRLADRVSLADTGFADQLHIPDPDVTYRERGSALALDFHAGNRQALSLSPRSAYGERIDHASGRRTVYVRDTLDGRAKVAFGGGVKAAGGGTSAERYGITYDRAGRPVDLVVVATLDVRGTTDLPPRLASIAGYLKIPLEGAKHVETEQHLDLTDPANAYAAAPFLARLGDDRMGIVLAAAALRDRLDRAGTVSVRTYAGATASHAVGAHGKVLGQGGGFEVGEDDDSSSLVAAVARRPDGTWGEDPTCLVA